MSLRNISPEGENNTEFIVEFQFISGFNGAVEKPCLTLQPEKMFNCTTRYIIHVL